jgi:hypothetical protein
MAFGQLKKPKIAADGVKSLAQLDGGTTAKGSGRDWARLGPSFKHGFSVIVAQASKVNIYQAKGKSKSPFWPVVHAHRLRSI